MNRPLLIGLSGAACLAALAAAMTEGRRLSDLRAEQRQLAAQLAGPEAAGLAASPPSQGSEAAQTAPVSPELLRLRAEVTRLSALRNQLAPARAENERLRAELAAMARNRVAGQTLPPGYLRRADAQLVGCNTPEATLQSFLWALHHQDSLRAVQMFTPQAVGEFQRRNPQADFLEHLGAKAFIGMAVVGKEQLPDGAVELRVLVAPDAPPMDLRLESIGGEWKIASP